MLSEFFTRHPSTVGESYSEHFWAAMRFSFLMGMGSAAALIHAVFPALFTSTGSTIVKRLHREMGARFSEKMNGNPSVQRMDWVVDYQI